MTTEGNATSRGVTELRLPLDESAVPPDTFDENGFDRSLVRESLRMSPAERLDLADGYAQEIEALRASVRGRRDVP